MLDAVQFFLLAAFRALFHKEEFRETATGAMVANAMIVACMSQVELKNCASVPLERLPERWFLSAAGKPEGRKMKVDVYKREEDNRLCSYLIVPHRQPVPQEVVSTDWLVHELDADFEQSGGVHFTLEPDDAFRQIDEKGYAITHLRDRSSDGAAH